MEIFRQSIADLVPPVCNTCRVEMAWSRSALEAEEKVVLHVFACPRCSEVALIRSQRLSEINKPSDEAQVVREHIDYQKAIIKKLGEEQ